MLIIEDINNVCIGWSNNSHVQFFTKILSDPRINNICICGVYYGRDIAYIKNINNSLYNRNIKITGIDLFSDDPGADWEEHKKNMTWEEFCGMPSPTKEKAENNLKKLNLFDNNITLIKNKDSDFLEQTNEQFDFIYLDTAHDYNTVKVSIDKSINKLNNFGIIGGDDFADSSTWGVKSAVEKSFYKYELIGSCWYTNFRDYIK